MARAVSRRRWLYSSVRSSSARAMRMLLSEPKPSRPPASFQIVPLKMPSPRLEFGDRAEPGDRAGRREAAGLVLGHVRQVDQRPAPVGRVVVEQPLDRPPAGGGHDLLDLGDLLGEVHVQRPLRPQRRAERQRLGADRAQRVRRHADSGVGRQVAERRLGGVEQADEAVGIGAEPLLPGAERPAIEAAELIMHRQERQADAGAARRGGDALRHLGDVVVGAAAGPVVEVVELDVGGVARLQHLHLHEARRSPRRRRASDGRGSGT